MKSKTMIILAVAVFMLALAILPGAETAEAKTAVVTDESGAVVTYYAPVSEVSACINVECNVPAGSSFFYWISGTYTAGGGLDETQLWGPVVYTNPTHVDLLFEVPGQYDLEYGSYTITGKYDSQGAKTTVLVNFDIVENSFTLTYDQMYDGQPDPKLTSEQLSGENYNIRDDITREGYYLEGWYTDDSLESQYKVTSETPFTANTDQILYANWLSPITKPTATTGFDYDGTVHTGIPEGTGYTLTGTASTAKAGDYTVTAKLNAGYTWSDSTTDDVVLNWSIAPKTVGIEWSATDSFVYDGASHVRQASLTGIVSGDACTPTITGERTDAGAGYTATVTGLNNSDYALPASGTTSTFSITERPVTIAVDSKTKTYGGSDPEFTGTVTGLVASGDLGTVSYVRIPADVGRENVADTIHIGATYTANPNYSVTVTQGILKIERAPITPSVSIDGWTYGSSANAPSVTGNPGSGAVTYEYKTRTGSTYSSTVPTHAGDYTVKATVAQTANYQSGTATADFAIAKKALTVTAENKSVTYGDAAPEYTASYSGLVPGDSQSVVENLNLSCTYAVGSDAGTYTISATGATAADYAVTCANGTLTVGKQQVPWPTDIPSAVFDGTEKTLAYNTTDKPYTYDGLTKGTNAGSYAVKLTLISNNYVWSGKGDEQLSWTQDSFQIEKATITAITTAFTKEYDGASHTPAKSDLIYTGFNSVKPADGKVSIALKGSDDGTSAGSHTAIVTVSGDSNFNDAQIEVSYSISQKPLTISISGQKAYDKSALESVLKDAKTAGLVSSDSLTAGKVRTTGYDARTYSVQDTDWTVSETFATSKGISNYTVTYEVSLKITKADPTYTAPVAKTDLVYDGNEKVLITGGTSSHGTFTYSLDGTTYSEDLPKAKEKGAHTVYWKLTGDANHNDAEGTVTAAIGVYKIAFNANGGSCSTSTMITDGNGKLSSLPSASRSGYSFNGWYTSASGGSEVTISTVFDKDTTVYAHWTANPETYRITFDGNGGTPEKVYKTTKTNGRLSSLPSDPVWEGHRFDGWYKTRVSEVKVTTSTVFSYNATVYAHWSEYSLGITYYANGGSGYMSYQNIMYTDASKALKANTFVRDGYVFAGWNTAVDGSGTWYSDGQDVSGLIVDANADLRLYAQWVAKHTVTFAVSEEGYGTVSKQSVTVLDGTAVSVSSDTVTIGDEKITATPAADTDQYHYAFVGWSGIPADGKVTSDITVTADFTRTENTYAVTVAVSDDGYGTVDRNSITVGYGAAISASDNLLYVGGERITATPAADTDQYSYIFVGWTGIPADGKVASDLTITADFAREDRRCNVTFAVSEGVTKVVKVIPGKTVTPIADPKLAGVEFKGWFLEGSSVRFDFSTPINEDITLYAHFGPKAPSTDQTSKITAVMSKDLTAVVTAYDGKIVGKGTMFVSVYQLMTIRDMQVYVEIGTFEESFDCSRPYFISDVSERTYSIASGPGSYAVMAEINLDNGTERLSNYTTFSKEGGM